MVAIKKALGSRTDAIAKLMLLVDSGRDIFTCRDTHHHSLLLYALPLRGLCYCTPSL